MIYVRSVATVATSCPDCTFITHLCLNTGHKLTREEAYRSVIGGAVLRSGSEHGPVLLPAMRDGTRYVRTMPEDTPSDNLLALPRTC